MIHIFAADGGVTDPVTIGLGIIAGALFFGEFVFFKWIYGPALDRADKQLNSAEDRHANELKIERDRYDKDIAAERERYSRLEDKYDRTTAVLEDKAWPALIAANTSVSQVKELVLELRAEQEEVARRKEIMEELERNK